MSVNLDAIAARDAAQGQQLLTDYRNKGTEFGSQYNRYSAEADEANRKVKSYTEYMQGEGSAGNQYRGELTRQLGQLGYDEGQMTGARNNLNQATGALSAYSDFANTAASKWGLNAGGFAAANAAALGGINNNIAAQQGVVSGLHDIYKTGQTGANQFTGQVVQGQHETMAGLQNVYINAANQRDSAGSMMNFYNDLAAKQGGLNANQQAQYAEAKAAYAAAQQSLAQATLAISQSRGQDLQNQMTSNNMNSKQYQDFLAGRVDASGRPVNQPAASAPAAAANNKNLGYYAENFNANARDLIGKAANGINRNRVLQLLPGF